MGVEQLNPGPGVGMMPEAGGQAVGPGGIEISLQPESGLEYRRKTDQNSPLRIISRMIKRGMEKLPPQMRLHPNIYNDAGAAGVLAASVMALNGEKEAALAAEVIFHMFDILDGPASQVFPDQTQIDPIEGAVRDHNRDMWKTLFGGLTRTILAHMDGDILGELAAAASTVVAPLTKITRAKRLAKDGVVVPELGPGAAAIRVPLEILAFAARLYPSLKKHDIQFLIDAFLTITSIKTAYDRLKYDPVKHPERRQEQPTPQDIIIAEKKYKTSVIMLAVTLAATAATLAYLHLPRKQEDR